MEQARVLLRTAPCPLGHPLLSVCPGESEGGIPRQTSTLGTSHSLGSLPGPSWLDLPPQSLNSLLSKLPTKEVKPLASKESSRLLDKTMMSGNSAPSGLTLSYPPPAKGPKAHQDHSQEHPLRPKGPWGEALVLCLSGLSPPSSPACGHEAYPRNHAYALLPMPLLQDPDEGLHSSFLVLGGLHRAHI